MTSQAQVPVTTRRDMSGTLAKMFNNPMFSNLKILVNDDVYYAEKNFLRVSSIVWEALLGSMPNSRMIEYRIHKVKHSESVLTILKYVYSISINLTKLSDEIVAEVIQLADMLLYMEFHNDLVTYVKANRPNVKYGTHSDENQITRELENVVLNDS